MTTISVLFDLPAFRWLLGHATAAKSFLHQLFIVCSVLINLIQLNHNPVIDLVAGVPDLRNGMTDFVESFFSNRHR